MGYYREFSKLAVVFLDSCGLFLTWVCAAANETPNANSPLSGVGFVYYWDGLRFGCCYVVIALGVS